MPDPDTPLPDPAAPAGGGVSGPAASTASSMPLTFVQAREDDARRLARLLRTQRITLVGGALPSERTALLREGVLPHLSRRAEDLPVRSAAGGKPPTAPPHADERRNRGESTPVLRGAERIVVFDAWRRSPLAALHAAIGRAMGLKPVPPLPSGRGLDDWIISLQHPRPQRILLVLDRFDEHLAASPTDPRVRAFDDALAQLINRPLLPVNVLIALDDVADRRLARLRERIPGFGAQAVDLTPVQVIEVADDTEDETVAPRASPSQTPDTSHEAWAASLQEAVGRAASLSRRQMRTLADDTRRPRPTPHPASMRPRDVYASIDARLERGSPSSWDDGPAAGDASSASGAVAKEPAAGGPAAASAPTPKAARMRPPRVPSAPPPIALPDAPRAPRPRPWRRARQAGLILGGAVLVSVLGWFVLTRLPMAASDGASPAIARPDGPLAKPPASLTAPGAPSPTHAAN